MTDFDDLANQQSSTSEPVDNTLNVTSTFRWTVTYGGITRAATWDRALTGDEITALTDAMREHPNNLAGAVKAAGLTDGCTVIEGL